MDMTEFDALAERLRTESSASLAKFDLALIDGRVVGDAEANSAETRMGVALPGKYKAFMATYGGGRFGLVDLLPIVAEPDGREDDLVTVNDREFPDRRFVAVAPVGTGDYWGFPVVESRCSEEVWFSFHDAGEPEFVAADFLAFVARQGLKS